jgi:hypothetical protein
MYLSSSKLCWATEELGHLLSEEAVDVSPGEGEWGGHSKFLQQHIAKTSEKPIT